jgi:hypothetical protein
VPGESSGAKKLNKILEFRIQESEFRIWNNPKNELPLFYSDF